MLALITQILLCLLAAAVVGFLVGWFLRREQLTELSREVERLRASAPSAVLPAALASRLEVLQVAMAELGKRPGPAAPAVDLGPIIQKLEALSGESGELSSRLAGVTTSLNGLRAPDLSGLERRLDLLAGRLEELARRPAPPSTPGEQRSGVLEVDLSPLQRRLDALAAAMEELRSRPAPAIDLGPLQANQEAAAEAIRTGLARTIDLSGIERRLDALSQEMAALQSRPPAPPLAPSAPRAPRPSKEERDNLILIHGVGPVLQRVLNRMGIYRFEQVMRWDANDIAAVTARLPNFKGRIEREGWVASARREYERKYGPPA